MDSFNAADFDLDALDIERFAIEEPGEHMDFGTSPRTTCFRTCTCPVTCGNEAHLPE